MQQLTLGLALAALSIGGYAAIKPAGSPAEVSDNSELLAQIKELKQLDAKKLKKNLVETRKKLEEQRKANEVLSKGNKEYKQERHEHQNTIANLEKELEKLKPVEEAEEKLLAEA